MMAWVDDRIYAHPRILSVGKPARWTFVAALAYSSGWGTRGYLTTGALEAISCDRRTLHELVAAELFVTVDGGWLIRGWDEHNERRDDRRERERARKKNARVNWPSSAPGRRTGANGAQDRRTPGAPRARVDGSEGSEEEPRAVTSQVDAARAPDEQPWNHNIENILQDMP